MQVENLELYHIHRKNRYSECWQVGKELITPTDGYNYFFGGLYDEPHQKISNWPTEQRLIEYLGSNIGKWHEIDRIQMLSSENNDMYAYSPHLLNILDKTFSALLTSRKIARELIYERVRMSINSNLPSRLRCIWLTSFENLNAWHSDFKETSSDCQIFKVSVTGKIFNADGSNVKLDIFKVSDFELAAEKYWRSEKSQSSTHLSEILFEGALKIIEKYNCPFELIKGK